MYSPQDQTAKAFIRDTAIELFGRHGFDAVPLRTIAETAGVSQPLIIKHYGSRSGLINVADEHTLEIVELALRGVAMESTEERHAAADLSVAAVLAGSSVGPYLARLLTADDDRARRAFARLVAFADGLVEQLADAGSIAPGADLRHLSAVLLVHDLSVLILRSRITEAIGIDPLAGEGLEQWSHTVNELYSGRSLINASTR